MRPGDDVGKLIASTRPCSPDVVVNRTEGRLQGGGPDRPLDDVKAGDEAIAIASRLIAQPTREWCRWCSTRASVSSDRTAC
jgi:hypothetical protein